MNDAVTWGLLIGLLSLGGTFIGFAVKVGRELQSAKDGSDAARIAAAAAGAKADLFMSQLSDFRAEVAKEYASGDDLRAAEERIINMLADLREDVKGLSGRLTNFLDSRTKA